MIVLGNEPNYTGYYPTYPRGYASAVYHPEDWLDTAYRWRARTVYREVIRHPLMPFGFLGIKVVDARNRPVSVKQYQDIVLIIEEGEPPYTVYFQPAFAPSPSSFVPPSGVPSKSLDELLRQSTPWFGLEEYKGHPAAYHATGVYNVFVGGVPVYGIGDQAYARLDNPNPIDVTPYVASIRNQEITLYVPVEQLDTLFTLSPRIVAIQRNGTEYVDYGVITQVIIEPLGTYKRITVRYVKVHEFYDLDVKELDTGEINLRSLTDPNQSSTEDLILHKILRAAGVPGTHTLDGRMRYSMFWLVPPPYGPGLPEDEALARYLNSISGSMFDAVRALAEANLLRTWNKPDGGLHFEPIVPFYGYTIDRFFDGTIPVQFFCVDSSGNYLLDPKLEIQSFTLDTGNIFSEIEVEGYSNSVVADFKQTNASFVTVAGQQRDYVEVDSGLWGNAYAAFEGYANSQKIDVYYDDPNQVHPNGNIGFRFRVMEGGSPKAKYYPVLWARAKGIDPYSQANFSYESGDANWWVQFRYVVDVEMKDTLANQLGVDSLAQELVNRGLDSGRVNAEKRRAIAGFWATPERNAVGACLGDPIFRMRWKVVDIDTATLAVKPLRAKSDPLFAPFWFPHFYEDFVVRYKNLQARGVKVVQNPFVTEISAPDFAVQIEQWSYVRDGWNNRTYGERLYTTVDANAKHLATWLTFEEFLKGRRARLRYYGSLTLRPRGFVAVAVKPQAGSKVEKYDLFWLGDDINLNMEVGKEVFVEADAYFIARFYKKSSGEWYVRYIPPETLLVDDGYTGGPSNVYMDQHAYANRIAQKYAEVETRYLPPRSTLKQVQGSENLNISVGVGPGTDVYLVQPIEPGEP